MSNERGAGKRGFSAGERAFWVDPVDLREPGEGTSQWVTVTSVPDGELQEDAILHCTTLAGGEVEVHPDELYRLSQPNGRPVDPASMTLFVVAEPQGKALSDEDKSVPGVYEMPLSNPGGVQDPGSAALDAFHEEIGIECLEHFEIRVEDAAGVVVPDTQP